MVRDNGILAVIDLTHCAEFATLLCINWRNELFLELLETNMDGHIGQQDRDFIVEL
jgi:hypothetical protein